MIVLARGLLVSIAACLGCATEPSALAGVAPDVGVVATDAAPETRDTTKPPGTLRIAAFNVRRLFDERCDSGACGGSDFEAVLSASAIEARTTVLAQKLGTLGAEAICLEEIETSALLDAIAKKMSYPTSVLGEIDQTASLDVGLLSTFPLITTKKHRDRVVLTRPDGSTTTFARELLEVHLDVRGKRAIVFCAHFRSKANDDPGRRLAEAQAAREIISAAAVENVGALVVLGGDLNDVPGSPPLDALEEGGALARLSASLPIEQIATYWFESRGSAIDHLHLATANGGLLRFEPGSFHVARDADGRAFAGSDHAAVYADFRGF